jgi:dephospho-CoA kinase
MILGIVGMPGSGKSVLAQYFRSVGLPVIRFGAFVLERIEKQGWRLTPENERIAREELRKEYGMAACARLALPQIRELLESGHHVVIDGLYSLAEYKLLREEFSDDLFVIAVVATKSLRYARLAQRPDRPLATAEATERDWHEVERLEKGGPIALADSTLTNDDSAEQLIEKAFELLHTLGIMGKISVRPREYYRMNTAARVEFLRLHVTDTESTDLNEQLLLHIFPNEHDPTARWLLVKALGIYRSAPALSTLIDICKQPDVSFGHTTLHSICAWALGRIGSGAYESVIMLLRERDPETRRCAVDALGELRDSRSIDALCSVLENDEHEVKLWAGLSLAKIGRVALPRLRSIASRSKGDTLVIIRDAVGKIEQNLASETV